MNHTGTVPAATSSPAQADQPGLILLTHPASRPPAQAHLGLASLDQTRIRANSSPRPSARRKRPYPLPRYAAATAARPRKSTCHWAPTPATRCQAPCT